jgi:hypothetical protein
MILAISRNAADIQPDRTRAVGLFVLHPIDL